MSNQPLLIVALHGDSPFANPSYQYKFAEKITRQVDNVIAVGLLRPGYTDHLDRKSDGVRGETVGDNYDNSRVMQVADTIEQLQKRHNAVKVIAAGHSGGSAIVAKLIALKPNLVDHALIVSCPCDINAWRKDMFSKRQYIGFKGDLAISSPIELVDKISPKTEVTIVIGDNDTVTKPYLSQDYYKALKQAEIKAQLKEIKGGHNIFLQPQVLETVLTLIDSHRKSHF